MTVKNAFGEIALESTQEQAVDVLHAILSRLGFADQVFGAMRVNVVTGATLAAVTTVGNQTYMGGYFANYDQYAAMNGMAQGIRNRITVT